MGKSFKQEKIKSHKKKAIKKWKKIDPKNSITRGFFPTLTNYNLTVEILRYLSLNKLT